ncbi:hypothetical protein CTAYLR_002155 [Chrysophaeum taylorii]|uniref:Mitochondrial carrier protein n=1 Tax=Chrysophaeum taylorii TaxID=2483200 RepID=A0AAD7UPR6_9STRA|nr:hypothetical protein CTAYLR_002155 [Chrysophaeum taylorii]
MAVGVVGLQYHAAPVRARPVSSRLMVQGVGLDRSGTPPTRGLARASEGALLGALSASVAGVFLWLVATRPETGPPPLFLVREIVAGGVAAAVAEITLYPIEVAKVKVQTRAEIRFGELLWRRPGVVAGTARALLYHGLRLGIFPAVKRAFPGDDGIARKLIAGAACGALGSVICNPLDLAKTRLQRDADRYANSLDALATIPREEPGALWVGAPASVARAAAGSAGQLATYDLVKSAFGGGTSSVAVLAATVASTLAYVTFAAPFDVAKSRLMVAKTKRDRQSLGACLVRIVRTEGPLTLFSGWLPAVLRLLPTTLLVFPLLEKLRLVLGTGAF